MYAWDIPMYSSAMAARIVGLSADRVRRWLRGYKYTYSVKSDNELRIGQKDSVFSRVQKDETFASFLELIDLLLVKELLEYGFSLQMIRKALFEAEEILDERHFARRCFFADAKGIYLQLKDKENADAMLQLLAQGQWVIKPVIEQTAQKIVFDEKTDYAKRYYPLGATDLIVLDPKISFGAPTIKGRGIQTENVYDLYIAEGENIESVCSWMELNKNEIDSAIRFEQYLAAA
jgi:uncharacterized protein (DUF433 family)